MKYVLILALCVGVMSCKKSPSASIISTSNSHFITQWKSDTLYEASNNAAIHFKDTLYTFQSGDTSCIMYKGEKLYVWVTDSPFLDSNYAYNFGWIGKHPFDTSDYYNKCYIKPYRYYSRSWKTQPFGIYILNWETHFDIYGTNGGYIH